MNLGASLRKSLAKSPRFARIYRKLRGSQPATAPTVAIQSAKPRKKRKRPALRRFELALPTRDDAEPQRTLAWEAPRKLTIPKALERDGLAKYEPETLACFMALVDVVRPGPVWDIGANVGMYGLLAASLSGRSVAAFEPTPETAAVARKVFAANGLRAEVYQWGLADQEGHATLYLSSSSDSSNSMLSGFREATGAITVPVRTIDRLVREGRTPPVILKIDTETTEPAILRGASELIAHHRPWILCEALPGRSEAELMDAMRAHNYTWHLVADEVPYAARSPIEGDVKYYMWLLAPEPIPQNLWDSMIFWRQRLKLCTPDAVAEVVASQQVPDSDRVQHESTSLT